MTLEIERAEKLANYLTADPQRGKMLLESPVEEALAAINADGNDFTIEELKAFGQAIVAASNDGELSAEDLDSVAGGLIGATKIFSIAAWVIRALCIYLKRIYVKQIYRWS